MIGRQGVIMININIKSKRSRFVIRYGILRFGIPAGITMMFLYELLNVKFNFSSFDFNRVFSIYSLLFIVLFLMGGYIWGELMWIIFIKKQTNQKTPHH